MNTTLISSQQPTLEQRSNAVDFGQQVSANVSFFSDNFVYVTAFRQLPVAFPSVRLDSAARFNILFNSPFQAWPRCIRCTPEPNSPDFTFFNLYHDNNQRFTRCTTTPLPRFFPTYVDLICLNGTRQTVSSRSYHSAPELVQPSPGSPIRTQIKNTLQSQGVRPILLTSEVPDSTKPKPQRFPGAMEYRTRCNVGFEPARGTPVDTSVPRPRFLIPAVGTSKAFGPAKLEQILETSFLSREPFFELKQCFWIVLHRGLFYTKTQGVSSAYPSFFILN